MDVADGSPDERHEETFDSDMRVEVHLNVCEGRFINEVVRSNFLRWRRGSDRNAVAPPSPQ